MVLAIELPLFSRIMQTRYHLKELSERNLILARVIKFCLLKGAFGNFCLLALQKEFGF